MKKNNGLNYGQVAIIAVAAELVLIVIQFAYLKIDAAANSDADAAFSSEYMKTRGFYIFQVIGFFIYTALSYLAVRNITSKLINKLLVLVLTGGVAELSFYLIISAGYEGAFLYSILDKSIAAVFGLILYNYTSKEVKKPDAYL